MGHETGKVTAGRVDSSSDSTSYKLTVSRETAPSSTYDVGEAFYDDVEIGTYVDLTVWQGRVAEVSYHGHRARNLSTPWLASFQLALVVAGGATLTVFGLTGTRRGIWLFHLIAYGFFVVLAFFGSIFLVSAQWPFAVILGIAVACWLFLTAAVAGITVAE